MLRIKRVADKNRALDETFCCSGTFIEMPVTSDLGKRIKHLVCKVEWGMLETGIGNTRADNWTTPILTGS